jgi:hypothetical protein
MPKAAAAGNPPRLAANAPAAVAPARALSQRAE